MGSVDNFLLRTSVRFWFVVAIAGQWAFFYYIMAFYGSSVLSNDLEIWNRLEALGAKPFRPGDTGGNLAFAAHALGAGIVAFSGALQLVPFIRRHAPRFHRWNGRVFLFTVIGLALSGFYLVWVRGSSPSILSAVGSSLNGFLILAFAFLAFYRVRTGDIASHRQWALRLYLVSNAQWFLRVGLFSYLMVARSLGFEVSLGGSFFTFWTFGCYLVPLGILQLYFFAAKTSNTGMRNTIACLLVTSTLLMALGIVGYTMFTQMIITGAPLAL